MSSVASPTLSAMEFDEPQPLVSDPVIPPPINAAPSSPGGQQQAGRLTRYLPFNKDEAFIGRLPSTQSEAIHLVKNECPSLSSIPSCEIALNVRFDGQTHLAVKDVLFRVTESAWPAAISDQLPLVFVDVKDSLISGGDATTRVQPDQSGDDKEKTWVDLNRRGALLGIRGWTDRGGGTWMNQDVKRDEMLEKSKTGPGGRGRAEATEGCEEYLRYNGMKSLE